LIESVESVSESVRVRLEFAPTTTLQAAIEVDMKSIGCCSVS